MGVPRTIILPYDKEAILSGDPKRLEETLHRLVVELESMYQELSTPLLGAFGEPGAPGAQGVEGSVGQAGVGIPKGGAVGAYLMKKSAADYDTQWALVQGASEEITLSLTALICSDLPSTVIVYTAPVTQGIALDLNTLLPAIAEGTVIVSEVPVTRSSSLDLATLMPGIAVGTVVA